MRRSSRFVLVAVSVLLVTGCAERSGGNDLGAGGPRPSSAPSGGPARGISVRVTRVVDGDTAEMLIGGREVDVRFIGIDTPETVAPGEPVQCFGPEASAYTERRLAGRTVQLEYDVERTDRYGRTLAYVWLGDELFNETLVAQGYALVTTYPPNVKYVDRFVAAQRAARDAGRGLWSACPAP